MFYCENELDKALKEQIFNIKIYFSDNYNLVVSGVLSKLFKSGVNNYYELVYVNTPDTIKDKIFSKMFKKQMEMKSGIGW
ncbi:hypothetical protein [Clostridium kluyveri]|nr:hypothetical protein [Clostridium kluyveri]